MSATLASMRKSRQYGFRYSKMGLLDLLLLFLRAHALLLLGAVVIGLGFGQLALTLLLTLTGVLLWHLHQLNQLLNHYSTDTLPTAELSGIWGGLQKRLFKQQRRHDKAEKNLKKQISHYQDMIEEIPNALVVLQNNSHAIIAFNRAASQLLGLNSLDRGQPIDHFIRIPDFVRYLNQPHSKTPLEPLILPSPTQQQTLLQMEIFPLSKKQRMVMATDMSHTHRLDQMRRDFVANVSHELRTPLTVIQGFVESMLEPNQAETTLTEWHEALDLMQQQNHRMGRLLDDLLLLAQLENQQLPAKRDRIDLAAMIDHLITSLLPVAEKRGITLQIEHPSGCTVELYGSEHELYSAFYNLIDNALRYTPSGGRVELFCVQSEHHFTVTVRDNGIGIEPQHLPRLTERFYRVDAGRSREVGGTGLGLAIVKHILNRHEAKLQIESRVGQGSRFSCLFPLPTLPAAPSST